MLSAVLGPVDRCIIDDITVIGQLHEDFEFDGGHGHPCGKFVEEEVCTLCCDRGVVQIFDCRLAQLLSDSRNKCPNFGIKSPRHWQSNLASTARLEVNAPGDSDGGLFV
jgi:hypothetical protein